MLKLRLILRGFKKRFLPAGIDTDKHKYPIGSGRVTFNNVPSYRKAVRAAFIEIKTPRFTKKVRPFLWKVLIMQKLEVKQYHIRPMSF